MESGTLVALVGATLLGGAFGSFGMNILIRTKRARNLVKRWSWWGVAAVYVLILSVVAVGFTWTVRAMLDASSNRQLLESPWFYLAFGVLIGLPFTLPTVTIVWRAERGGARDVRRKVRQATREERLRFAKDLEGQIREFVGTTRPVHLELQGEKGRVLVFGGDFTREEGERLVAALRADLEAVDFARVEGQGTRGKWWVRVTAPKLSDGDSKREP